MSFPLFPWLAYGLVGLAWGLWLRGSEEAVFFRRAALSGLVLLGAATPAFLADPRVLLGHHWRVGPACSPGSRASCWSGWRCATSPPRACPP